jgi:hypothetical protein
MLFGLPPNTATLSCCRQASTGALTEQITLELAHHREDPENKLDTSKNLGFPAAD